MAFVLKFADGPRDAIAGAKLILEGRFEVLADAIQ